MKSLLTLKRTGLMKLQEPTFVAKNYWVNHTEETKVKWGKDAQAKRSLHYSRLKKGPLKARYRKHLRRILALEPAMQWFGELGVNLTHGGRAQLIARLQFEYNMYAAAFKFYEEKMNAPAEPVENNTPTPTQA